MKLYKKPLFSFFLITKDIITTSTGSGGSGDNDVVENDKKWGL